MKNILIIFALLTIFSSVSFAEEAASGFNPLSFIGLKGGKLQFNAHAGAGSVSLKDALDNIYIGDLGKVNGMNFGSQALLLAPIANNVSLGPNFNYNFCETAGTWYTFTFHEFSIGPAVKIDLGGPALISYFNYDLGFVSAVQEITGTGIIAPAGGSVVANVRGFLVGLQGYLPITDSIAIGPYLTYGSRAMLAFKYKKLNISSNKYEDNWINIEFTSTLFGMTVYLR